MPRSALNKMTEGGRGAGALIAGGGGIKSSGYRSGIADMANADYLMTRADLAHAQLDKATRAAAPPDPNELADATAVSNGISAPLARAYLQHLLGKDTPDPTSAPSGDATYSSGIPPELEKVLQGGIGDLMTQQHLTGKTNFEQLQAGKGKKIQAQALGNALDQALANPTAAPANAPGVGVGTVYKGGYDPAADLTAKMAPGSTAKFAKTLSVGAGKEITPFTTNAQGTVLDAMSGDLNEGGALAGAFRDLLGAKQDKEQAHGDLYDAKADEAHAGKTGKAALAPSEQRMFEFYRQAFPDDTTEQTFTRVKAKRGEEPSVSMDKTRRELIKAHPRWTAEQVNEWAGKLHGQDKPAASSSTTTPDPAKPHVDYFRSVKDNPQLLKAHIEKLKAANYSREEVAKMLDAAGVQ